MREIRSAGSARGDGHKSVCLRPVPTHHNIDHELLLRAIRKHVTCKWALLYIERWLRAPMMREDGTTIERDRGTPQGGVVTPRTQKITRLLRG